MKDSLAIPKEDVVRLVDRFHELTLELRPLLTTTDVIQVNKASHLMINLVCRIGLESNMSPEASVRWITMAFLIAAEAVLTSYAQEDPPTT